MIGALFYVMHVTGICDGQWDIQACHGKRFYHVNVNYYFIFISILHMGCGDVVTSTVTMVVATTPCCRYEKLVITCGLI